MKHTPEEIKNRLSNIGEAIGNIALDYIAELEKENAELKEQHEVSARNMSSFIESLSKSENEAKKQLTKAKEILKSLYFIIESRIDYKNNIGIVDEMWRAKQFWKESE